MMTTDTIKQNNFAVSLIECGQYVEATSILKVAIGGIKEELRVQMADECQSEKSENAIHQCILQSLQNRPTQQEDIQYMYSQAVPIPLHVAALTDTSHAVVSSILILNFALALHMSADATTDVALRESRLAKTLSLYRLLMVYNSTSTLLCMIVLNNVGLLHRRYNDRERAQECFNKLVAIWMHSPVQMQHLEGIIFKAMGWYDGLLLPAAAA